MSQDDILRSLWEYRNPTASLTGVCQTTRLEYRDYSSLYACEHKISVTRDFKHISPANQIITNCKYLEINLN